MSEAPWYTQNAELYTLHHRRPGGYRVQLVRVSGVWFESGLLRAVHLPRHKWPGGLVN